LEQLTSKEKPQFTKSIMLILLKADINSTQGEWTDQAISQALDISPATIERVRQRFVEQGMEALNRQVQQNANPGDSTVNNKRICSRCCVVQHQKAKTLDFTFVSRG